MFYFVGPISYDGLNGKEALRLWCNSKLEEYHLSTEFNFKSLNGMALCALIHVHRPKVIMDYHLCEQKSNFDNLEYAFSIAESLGIPRLLDPEDIYVFDESSYIMYVTMYYHLFKRYD